MDLTFLFIGIIVGLTIGVLVDRYLLPIGDTMLQTFANFKTLQATEIQRDITHVEKDIRDIRMSSQQSDIQAIGFKHEYSEDIYDEDSDDDLHNKQIGFRQER
jgi:hypothetical protein